MQGITADASQTPNTISLYFQCDVWCIKEASTPLLPLHVLPETTPWDIQG